MEQSGRQQNFPVKSGIVTILGFSGPTVSDAAARRCCCRVKALREGTQMSECVCVPIELIYKNWQQAEFGHEL